MSSKWIITEGIRPDGVSAWIYCRSDKDTRTIVLSTGCHHCIGTVEFYA